MRCKRNEVSGNILKRVVTRVDFQDLFELPKDILREISQIASKHGIELNTPKFLEMSDFQFNDNNISIMYPYEYIRDLNSTLIYNKEKTFIIEVNQLFLKITQVVNSEYKRYGQTLEILSEIFNVLKDPEKVGVKIRRISIKKANQVFFNSINKFEEFFKKEILIFNQFENIDWSKDKSQSMMVQNFLYKDSKVNFTKVYDNGLIKKNKYYRLYFDIEAYLNEDDDLQVDIKQTLENLNEKIFELFEWTLTDKGIQSLKNGERIGDIDA